MKLPRRLATAPAYERSDGSGENYPFATVARHHCPPRCGGRAVELELTLEEYNRLTAPLLQRTITVMEKVLDDAGLQHEDIDRVILVGGSTKNKAVRDTVARAIKYPYIAEQVDEVVAHGAAHVAASLSLPDQDYAPVEITNVTPQSLGIGVLENNKLVFLPLIRRQSTYPCTQGFLGSTNRPYQDALEVLNEPRYASLPNIMKAKKKPIADKTPADYGVDIAPRLQVLKTTEPPGRKSGAKVASVAELVDKLKDEAGVL